MDMRKDRCIYICMYIHARVQLRSKVSMGSKMETLRIGWLGCIMDLQGELRRFCKAVYLSSISGR